MILFIFSKYYVAVHIVIGDKFTIHLQSVFCLLQTGILFESACKCYLYQKIKHQTYFELLSKPDDTDSLYELIPEKKNCT